MKKLINKILFSPVLIMIVMQEKVES